MSEPTGNQMPTENQASTGNPVPTDNQTTGDSSAPAGNASPVGDATAADNGAKKNRQKPVRKKKIRKKRSVKKTPVKKVPLKTKLLIACGIILFAALIAGLLSYFLLLRGEEKEEVLEEQLTELIIEEEKVAEQKGIGDAVISHILKAKKAVDDSVNERPDAHEVTAENAADFAEISSCIIDDSGKVSVTLSGDGIAKSDDKYYYLFDLNTYDTALVSDAQYLDRIYKDEEVTLTTSLNYNHSSSKLFKKFVVAVKKDGSYLPITGEKYITNPEAIAKYASVYQTPSSKKGLLVDPNRMRGLELDDLGVRQAAYNIPVARLLGPTTSSNYPSIQYTYNGHTYTLNGQVVAEYDLVFSTLTAKGITTTAIILNNYSSSYPQLIHPKSRGGLGSAPYYMFNGAEESGVEYMAMIATFLAERYSDTTHGKISNWVISNEINARKEWNYMEKVSTSEYVEAYAQAFRVFYTAIKSVSSSARIYMPLDQQWDRNLKNNTNYDGRDILDEFNRNITAEGNIDWGLAQHPYNVPLTDARTWKSNKLVTHSSDTSMITMANIEVLTNYMTQETLLSPSGEVRSILLSEQGYTSSSSQAVQAAAIAYAYYKVANNAHIDGFLLNRQTDAAEEVAQGLAFGLNSSDGGHKQSYTVYKYIDTAEWESYAEFAKSIIGISSWSEILR